ncbi:protein FAR1-RELATED SEQUENCE 5-like [Zingiber officinale]|uniref:protein FAR1-RELATED SEQUENCE 5-like n=1 Tax=Zingiber officinale TaxID=94328 RepID=UPI001C4ACF24|nr:protein FAR1-RELATED SEQUENCE 5-like [Zingiber officinale]
MSLWLLVEGEETIMEEAKFDSNEMKDDTDHADQDLSPSTVEEVKVPEIGMIFSSEEEIRTFYNSYATSVGFAKNALHPRPSSKTNCKAKINVAVRNDGNFVITSVDLEHNHLLSLVEAGGYENLSFDERKCRNYISEARRLRLGEGDAEALSNYFCHARCRAAYDYFCDVMTFDTTYLTNSYDMPFAPFVGVNHHGQSILLGCELISSEDSTTFTWLFNSWLTCMHGCAPKAIITDQCRAMTIAIEEVFPNSHHRLCLWHIMKKLPVELGGHAQYKLIKKQLKTIVYNSLTVDECDENWLKMIEDFKLENNDWLKSLYDERNIWIPVYVKGHFWASMSTTQRSESMNAFFDDYVHSKTSLKQFVEQYDSALKKNIENEKNLDFVSFNSIMPVILGHSIERQFQNAYTNNIFKLFQDEIRGLMFCDASLLREEGTTLIFEVVENMLGNNGQPGREVSFRVHYTELHCQLKCVCRLFEFRGILCRHVIKVLMTMKVIEVPMSYIMDRWRKDIKRGYQSISNIYDEYDCSEKRLRYNTLTPLMQEVQQLGAESDDICSVLVEIMKDTKEKLIIAMENGQSRAGQFEEASTSGPKVIHSPLKVRTKGRPPTKRKQSKVEQIMNKSIAKGQKEVCDAYNRYLK